MSWIGFIQFPDHIRYLIENVLPKLNETSLLEEWLECLYSLRKHKHYIWNEDLQAETTIFPSNRWTLVHHAAHFNAPIKFFQMLSIDRYPLSLPDAEGKLARHHLDAKAPQQVKALLEPTYKINFQRMELKLLQVNFHKVIHERVEALVKKYNLILPVLSVMLEDVSKDKEMFFNIPGMYGGFAYWFEFDETKTKIIALWCHSSSRLSGHSEQLHKCTTEGWNLMN